MPMREAPDRGASEVTEHRTPFRHGTYAGVQRHKKDGTELCEPCRQARNTYRREHYAKRGKPAARMAATTRELAFQQLAALHRDEYEAILNRIRLEARQVAA